MKVLGKKLNSTHTIGIIFIIIIILLIILRLLRIVKLSKIIQKWTLKRKYNQQSDEDNT